MDTTEDFDAFFDWYVIRSDDMKGEEGQVTFMFKLGDSDYLT